MILRHFAITAAVVGSACSPVQTEKREAAAVAKPATCEIHAVAVVEKPMPATPFKGIEDNGYHSEVDAYYEASQAKFPYVGTNPPSCGYHGGQVFPICPECVKEEKKWIRRHPRVPAPQYGNPDPRES